MASASQEYRRRAQRAKGKVIAFDTAKETSVFDITTLATTGTFGSAASTANGLTITVNGTNYKIPLFTSP
jgi:hypothetical protein